MFIPFNHTLLQDLDGQPEEKLAELCPGLNLTDFLMFRMMEVKDGKFVLTAMGKSMVEFATRQEEIPPPDQVS